VNEMIVVRTPFLIAAEINSIKEQTRKMVIANSIEIGRRLVEAKSVVEHGQWSKWLEDSVEYSQSTANNLMRIFEEYGSDQIALFGNNANSQALGNLSYTQAVALLGIPQDEREQFVEEHNLDKMSTRELQQAIKEKQELALKLVKAEADKREAENGLTEARKQADKEHQACETISESYKRLEQVNHKHYETAERLKKELEDAKKFYDPEKVGRLQVALAQTDQELKKSRTRMEELELQLKEKPIEIPVETIVEKVPEEIERELDELRKRTKELELKTNQQSSESILKYTVHFDYLVKGFKDLLGSLAEIKQTNPEAYEKYKKAVITLAGKMSGHLNA
jgi:chromosome segregation ATPase